jgi:hypothetical protein
MEAMSSLKRKKKLPTRTDDKKASSYMDFNEKRKQKARVNSTEISCLLRPGNHAMERRIKANTKVNIGDVCASPCRQERLCHRQVVYRSHCMSICGIILSTIAILGLFLVLWHVFYTLAQPRYTSTSVWFDGRLVRSSGGEHGERSPRASDIPRTIDELTPKIAKLYYEFETTTDVATYVRYPEFGGIRGLHKDGLIDFNLCCMSRRNIYVCNNGGTTMAQKYGVDCMLKFEDSNVDADADLENDEHGFIKLYVEDPTLCGCKCKLVWTSELGHMNEEFEIFDPYVSETPEADSPEAQVETTVFVEEKKRHNIE